MIIIQPLTTGASKVAVVATPILVVALPIINTVTQGQLQLLLNYIIASLIGIALGWMAGDALTHFSKPRKVASVLAGLVIAVLANIASIRKAWHEAGLHAQLLHELFVRPFQSGSLMGSVQWATLAFVVSMLAAIFYILTK